jgi:glycosyltransferase involved in cell wall biosynthesis
VIPFGANLDRIPSAETALSRKRSGECRLLFLGIDWERKGGDIAIEALASLEEDYGIRASLTVCGCEVPKQVNHERLTITGFLDKRDAIQAKQLERLFEEADYLLVPTRSECYGMVFCEASAHGVPSISTDTGGVSGAISEGRNGRLLPETARGEEYARVIAGIEADDEYYSELSQSSRHEYEARINWDVWARHVDMIVDGLKR